MRSIMSIGFSVFAGIALASIFLISGCGPPALRCSARIMYTILPAGSVLIRDFLLPFERRVSTRLFTK